MSLLKLYASGCQTDNITYKIVYNNDNKYDNECKHCINENRRPNLFFYYGPKLCSKILHYNIEYYNIICDKGHCFRASVFFEM